MLALSDLSEMTEEEVKSHIASNYYGDTFGFGEKSPCAMSEDEIKAKLMGMNVIAAYENVGNWGCDSTSWFLFEDKSSGELFELHGGHCSCYGFEGQFELESTSVEYLKSENFYFYTGGYDDCGKENEKKIKALIESM